jgi:hypothetical protein
MAKRRQRVGAFFAALSRGEANFADFLAEDLTGSGSQPFRTVDEAKSG